MDQEFKIHLKVLKYFNFNKDQPKKERYYAMIFQVFNLLVNFYCLFGHFTFVAMNYNDVFEISECLSTICMVLITLAKFHVLCIYYYMFFGMIDEIKLLNQKCK